MGFFDFFNSDERRKNRAALEIDIQAGVLERCPLCNSVYDRGHDERLATADATAHRAFDRADPLVAPFNGDRTDLLKRLRDVRKPYPYNCPCQDAG